MKLALLYIENECFKQPVCKPLSWLRSCNLIKVMDLIIRSTKSVLKYILSIFLPAVIQFSVVKGQAAIRCVDLFGDNKYTQSTAVKLSSPIVRNIEGLGEVVFDRQIGVSTAKVLISADSKIIMKIYDPQIAGMMSTNAMRMGLREFFMLRYLGSRGIRTSIAIAEPKIEQHPFENYNVLILYKYAVRGLSGKEIIASIENDSLKGIIPHDRIAKATDVGGDSKRRYFELASNPEFPNMFSEWLRTQPDVRYPHVPEQLKPLRNVAISDAIKDSNYIFDLDHNEWVLIDP